MIYKNFGNIKLSALGLGCMRFPTLDGDGGKIDLDALHEMVSFAIENGINYFDTAWIYHGGNSEWAMGQELKKYPRESFYLATKFPGFEKQYIGRVEEIFEKQIERCGVDYFDFYLFHNVCESDIDDYLNPKYKTLEYLLEQKRLGRIRHLGFSTHGTIETMRRFLDAYGEHMEFCQIQLNWLDYKLQNAKAKLELLKEYGLPVWVMEPLRGGKLARLDGEYKDYLGAVRPEWSLAEWGFRFLQSFDNVTVTLSGMSDMAQLSENVKTFDKPNPLNEKELGVILGLADKMTERTSLPCTACRYCTDGCPMGLDIPLIIEKYNEFSYSGARFVPMAVEYLEENKKPAACIGCRACEAVCPQGIKISEALRDFNEKIMAVKSRKQN